MIWKLLPTRSAPLRLRGLWTLLAVACAAAAAAGCQESLPLQTSGVSWLCVSNADCGADRVCDFTRPPFAGAQSIGTCQTTGQSPDAQQPDSTSPDTVGPDTVGPDTVGPDTVGPDTVDPDAVTPDADAVDAAETVDHEDHKLYRGTESTTGYVKVDGVRYPLLAIVPFNNAQFGDAIALRYDCRPSLVELQVFLTSAWPDGKPTGRVRVVMEDGTTFETTGATVSSGPTTYSGLGTATQAGAPGNTREFEFTASREHTQGTTLYFSDDTPVPLAANEVLVQGYFVDDTFRAFQHVVAAHPEVDTVVFGCWLGIGGGQVQIMGTNLRQRGFKTRMRAGSHVSSGWLFIAGQERTLDPGVELLAEGAANKAGAAIFETTPWVDSTFGTTITTAQFPCPSHNVHTGTVGYFGKMLGEPQGTDFYCWTLADEFNNRVTLSDLAPYGVFTSSGASSR
ncbi:MAG: hypothetical protein H6744_15060 [Deltaproteobacteria bacterium]|nr:hypothetical protein [Deltaproteobacteria bacterium]MCB9788000.1 hypothetical protein [Deltaproteobacteria bacterium]